MRAILSLPVLALLVACAPEGEDAPQPVPTASPVATETPVAVAKPTLAAGQRISLSANGLVIGSPAATTIVFESAQDETERRISAILGPLERREVNGECGAGRMEFSHWGPLQLSFAEDRLIGWYLTGPGSIVTTDGIAPGLTRAQLETERSVVMEDSTLDYEFSYGTPDGGQIYGFFSGGGADATVEALHAGYNCFFR